MPNKITSKILLTTLSAKPSYDVPYWFRDKVVIASQSPVALIQLLPVKELPDRIIILCTKKLHNEQYESVRTVLLNYYQKISKPIEVTEVMIPDGLVVDELWQILESALQSIPPKCELTLDVTHGFRSVSFLYFTAALFLKALYEVEIKAVYYAMLEATSTEKPIIDLSILLDMAEWFYATRIFRQTGQASPLCELLRPFEKHSHGLATHDKNNPYQLVTNIRSALESVSAAYAQALPLELGCETEQLLRKFDETIPKHLERTKVPLAEQLFGSVISFAKSFAFPANKPNTEKEKDNKNLELSQTELERQARIIDSYLEQGYIHYALGIIREWMISCAIWHQHVGTDSFNWLEKNKRKELENKFFHLNRIFQHSKKNPTIRILSPEQCWLADKWDFLSKKRNQLAHHGFSHKNALQSSQEVKEIKNKWQELKKYMTSAAHWNLD